jgi:hypothetical protein
VASAPARAAAGTVAVRAVAAVALVLAGLDLVVPGAEAPVPATLALDVSASSTGRGGEEARAAGSSERVVFADGVRLARRGDDLSSLSRERTRLAEAIRFATDRAVEAGGRRVILVTDGRDTEGGALDAARALAARGLALDVSPPDPPPSDVGLLQARIAEEAPGGARSVEVRVAGNVPGRVRVSLVRGAATVDALEVAVAPEGDAVVRLVDAPTAPEEAGYEVRLVPLDGTPDDDEGDDRLALAARGASPLVVVLDPSPWKTPVPGARVLSAGADATVAEVEAADALAVSNQPWRRLGPAAAERLVRHVAEGGVLVTLGGPDAYGPGGWAGTALEAVLPLRSVPPSGETAVLLALDASGSTGETPPDGGPTPIASLAHAATLLLESLPGSTTAAVLPFRATAEGAPLAPGWVASGDATARDALATAVARVVPGGGTDLVAALVAGAKVLAARPGASRRLLVLATDGDPDHALSEASMAPARAALAAAGVEAAAVVRGDTRAAAALASVAGDPSRVAVVSATGEIPEAVLRLFARARGREELVAGPFAVTAEAGVEEGAALAALAPSRLHALEAAPGAVLLATASGGGGHVRPFAAERRLGAGRVVSIAWGPALEGPEAVPAARAAVAPLLVAWARGADRGLSAEGDERGLEIRAEAGKGSVRARRGGDGTPVDLLEAAPGVYRGPWPGLGEEDPAPIEARVGSGPWRAVRLPARPPVERRGCGVDAPALAALAAAGGGRLLAAGESSPPSKAPQRAPLAPWLALLAVALLVVDRARTSSAARQARMEA